MRSAVTKKILGPWQAKTEEEFGIYASKNEQNR